MLEQRRKFGFINEGPDQVAFIREVRQYLFDGNPFFKAVIPRHLCKIQFGHTARRNFLQQLVFPELLGFKILH